MNSVIDKIVKEADSAHSIYGSFCSTHEALGVLEEEYRELKDAIHANQQEDVYEESVQVAAVAYRLALICIQNIPEFSKRSGF